MARLLKKTQNILCSCFTAMVFSYFSVPGHLIYACFCRGG